MLADPAHLDARDIEPASPSRKVIPSSRLGRANASETFLIFLFRPGHNFFFSDKKTEFVAMLRLSETIAEREKNRFRL